jgi:hypothetical protein
MRNITEREAIDVRDVFRQPGWQYFENEYLPELRRQLIQSILEVPSNFEADKQREQYIGQANLAETIVHKFKTQIQNHVDNQEV